MSPLVSRLLLALFMLPSATVLYVICIFSIMEWWGFRNEEEAFLMTGALTVGYIVVYWLLLWRRSVNWSRRRVVYTLISGAGSLLVGIGFGVPLATFEDSFGIFVATIVSVNLWLILSALIFRETAGERVRRLSTAGVQIMTCPSCGYNLTGLKSTTCPECGQVFTLNEIVAGQAGRESAELDH